MKSSKIVIIKKIKIFSRLLYMKITNSLLKFLLLYMLFLTNSLKQKFIKSFNLFSLNKSYMSISSNYLVDNIQSVLKRIELVIITIINIAP